MDRAPRVGDTVVLPSGRPVVIRSVSTPACRWVACKVRSHWEVQRPGLLSGQPSRFRPGRFPAPALTEADARALADFLNAALPAERTRGMTVAL